MFTNLIKHVAADLFTYQSIRFIYSERISYNSVRNILVSFAVVHYGITFSDDAIKYIIRKYNVSPIICKVKDVLLTVFYLTLAKKYENPDFSMLTIFILTSCNIILMSHKN